MSNGIKYNQQIRCHKKINMSIRMFNRKKSCKNIASNDKFRSLGV
jgi:hypothetical protein